MDSLTVREYARLTTTPIREPSLDRAHISDSAFAWLCRASSKIADFGAALVVVEDREWLKLDNYVGVIETPCGTRIEIVPKTAEAGDDIASARDLLRRMISRAMDLPVRQLEEAALQRFDAPISEWVIGRFLSELRHLVRRGLRADYVNVEAEERYLRGQLAHARQIRQPPGRQHLFQISHDVFMHDRAENRLLRSALERAAHLSQTPQNWRLAQELRERLLELPSSRNIDADFRAWRSDRLMAHYRAVRPWCELILYRQMPWSLAGAWHGISLLFPMEKLFEKFVAHWLRSNIGPRASLSAPGRSQFLCRHLGAPIFRLEPDFLIQDEGHCWILDAKWKRLNAKDRATNYHLSQSDLYQLFAYGSKYFGSKAGKLALVFPRWSGLQEALPPFEFGDGLDLHVLPFDLNREELVGAEALELPHG